MNEAKLAERVIQLCPELMGENRRPHGVVRNPRTVLALVDLVEQLLENDLEWRAHSTVLADQRDKYMALWTKVGEKALDDKLEFMGMAWDE
jgi:hypothetical protein